MKKNRRILFLGVLALLLAVPLMLLLKDFSREAVVSPLLFAAWLVDFFFKILPQAIIWLLFLSVGILVAVKSIVAPHNPESRQALADKTYLSRVMVWEKWIRLSAQGDFSRWNLARHLADLVVKTMAYSGQVEPEKIRRQLRQGSLQAQPEIQAYLRAALLSKIPVGPNWFGRLKRFIVRKGLIFNANTDQSESSVLELDPELIIQYLEQQLEVTNEHRNH